MLEILTKRQAEFLEVIKELYLESDQPVHYETVGRQLGVSKWTAYDHIRALEKKGFVDSIYINDRTTSQVGRPRIGIIPKLYQVDVKESQDIREKKRELLATLQQWQTSFKQINLQELAKEAKKCSIPELNCLYMITIVVLILKKKQEIGAASWIKGFFSTLSPEISIISSVGLVVGIIFNSSLNKGESSDMLEWFKEQLVKAQHSLAQFSEQEKVRLAKFWERALEASQLV